LLACLMPLANAPVRYAQGSTSADSDERCILICWPLLGTILVCRYHPKMLPVLGGGCTEPANHNRFAFTTLVPSPDRLHLVVEPQGVVFSPLAMQTRSTVISTTQPRGDSWALKLWGAEKQVDLILSTFDKPPEGDPTTAALPAKTPGDLFAYQQKIVPCEHPRPLRISVEGV
jgi:hypothetical protein